MMFLWLELSLLQNADLLIIIFRPLLVKLVYISFWCCHSDEITAAGGFIQSNLVFIAVSILQRFIYQMFLFQKISRYVMYLHIYVNQWGWSVYHCITIG